MYTNIVSLYLIEKVILFLTDGSPTDSYNSIMNTLKDRNSQQNNQVILLTFGLGDSESFFQLCGVFCRPMESHIRILVYMYVLYDITQGNDQFIVLEGVHVFCSNNLFASIKPPEYKILCSILHAYNRNPNQKKLFSPY